MKRTVSFVLAAGIAWGAFAGTAAASTPLESAVDRLIGIGYQYGGTTTKGFDCSGFTSYVFEQFGIELPRTSKDQAAVGTKVAKSELKAGDLVFFNTSGKGISHVGIYLGDGTFAHASTSRGVIITDLNDSYYAKRYVTARRILSDAQFQNIATEAPPVPSVEENLEIAAYTEMQELETEQPGEEVDPNQVVQTLEQTLESEQ